jgi:ERCC4-type nuclease
MILVDDRIGSVHYASKLHPSQVERLEFGDICFEASNGQLVGIEIKKINDAVGSLLSGRLAEHQIPGMLSMYGVSYIIVEGYYRCDPVSGLIQGWTGGSWRDIHNKRQSITWESLDNWLTSIETLANIRIRRTVSEKETVRTIQSLYNWWGREDHRSMKVFNTASRAAGIEPPNLLRRVVKELPGIGWERSIVVADHFGTIWNMANASEEEWITIEGIGEGIAGKVYRAINGESK